jgi:mannose-6-phosphate isomerase-like protein (cupin superfamily)
MPNFGSKRAKAEMDYEAPDKSEIRLLTEVSRSSVALVTLRPQMISGAKVHKTVDEQWYLVQGIGQVWLKDQEISEVIDVNPGVAIAIPKGVYFQSRNTGWEPLSFICIDSPKWPAHGEEVRKETVSVQGKW